MTMCLSSPGTAQYIIFVVAHCTVIFNKTRKKLQPLHYS